MQKPTLTVHVSPGGSDAWSGRRARPSSDGADGPVATLERARDLVRRARADRPERPVEVVLHEGVYRRRAPLVLGPEDSGAAGAPVVWRGLGDCGAVVTGLDVLRGAWTRRDDGVWAMPLRTTSGVPASFRQLFCNGRRLQRTRLPSQGWFRVYGFAGEGDDDHKRRFRFSRGDMRRWANLEDVECLVLHKWSESRLPVKHIDPADEVVEFTGPAAYPFDFGGWNVYCVENVKEALGQPGQWYLDRRESVLYLVPPEGLDDPNDAELSVPVADALLELRAVEGNPVEHVRFENLAFKGTRWQMSATGYANGGGSQGPHVRPAGLTFAGAEDCALHGCVVDAVAGYAVEMADCRRCEVSHTTICEGGAGGVMIVEGADNAVEDCHIHDCGKLYLGGAGVVNPSGLRTRIRHNHVHHMPYCGLRGGDWGKPLEELTEYNHVHDVMRVLDDGAGIFNAGIGSTIRYNLVHDCVGGQSGFAIGIYLDEFRTGVTIEKNVVYNTGRELLQLHNNWGNTIVNNIFACGGAAQISWTVFHGIHFGRRIEPYRHPLSTFRRNIVYWREGCLSHNLDCNRWDLATRADLVDYNLYWKAGQADLQAPRIGRIPAGQVRLGLGHNGRPGVGHDTLAD